MIGVRVRVIGYTKLGVGTLMAYIEECLWSAKDERSSLKSLAEMKSSDYAAKPWLSSWTGTLIFFCMIPVAIMSGVAAGSLTA